MESYLFEHPLPSCGVNMGLIVKVENYLQMQVPKVLMREIARMMEVLDLKSASSLKKYSVTLQDKSGTRELASIADCPEKLFPPSIKRIALKLHVGRPEILAVTVVFARNERPKLELTTLSKQVSKSCPRIADGIKGIVKAWGNRNWIFHSRLTQFLLALLVPAAVIGYGHLQGIEPFFLYSTQGWLFLLAGTLSLTLPRIFPLVSFQTRRHINPVKLLLLLLLALNLAAISGYVGLLMFELERLRL